MGPRTPAGPPWSTDLTLLVTKTVTAHVECIHRHNDSHVSRSHRKLLVVKFSHPGLDEVRLGSIVNDPLIVASIPLQYREKVGTPLVAFKYEKPIGMQWHNTRRYAHMSDTDLAVIRTQLCSCHDIDDRFKEDGHLRTSDLHVLPDRGSLRQLCAMGAKFRPSLESAVLDAGSKVGIISSLTSSVKDFARKGADRALNTECMNEWQALVIQRITDTVNNIPDGTCCMETMPLSYTRSDEIEMQSFLRDKVCTSMDKAAGTIMFNCQLDYVNRMQADLDANTVFEISPRMQSDIVQESNDFGSRYGFAPDARNQDIPYYKGIDKMLHILPWHLLHMLLWRLLQCSSCTCCFGICCTVHLASF